MAKYTRKNVPLVDFVEDFTFNFSREPKVENYDDLQMQSSLANVGQKAPGKALRGPDGKHKMMVGNRRLHNILILAAKGIEDPKTCRRTDEGEIIRGSGKPFTTMEVDVYESLTPREIVELSIDNDESLGLTKAEVQLQLEKAFEVTLGNERESAKLCYYGIVKHYDSERTPFKPIQEDNGVSFLFAKKGVIDTAKKIWKAPLPLHDLCMQKLRTRGLGWPTNKEVAEGVKIHENEEKACPTRTISKENPGPLFMAWYDRLIEVHSQPDAAGNKKKTVSALNRDQMETFAALSANGFTRWIIGFCVKDPRVNENAAGTMNALLLELFKALTPRQLEIYNSCWNVPEVEVPVEAPAPAKIETKELVPA